MKFSANQHYMRRILGFLIVLPFIGFSQDITTDVGEILENEISKITITIKAVQLLHDFDSLIVGEHHFNELGLKTYEKLVFPYQDVVATENQTYYHYEKGGILVKKIKTQNAIRLTKRDDNYINFFGIDYDTTIIQYHYLANGLLQSEIKYSNTTKDSIRREYFYNTKHQLIKLLQSNTSQENPSPEENFKKIYFYSSQDLLDSVQKQLTGFDFYSTEIYTYDENQKIASKRLMNGFEFRVIVNYGADNEIMISQSLDNGNIQKNQYDKKGRLVKREMGFTSNKRIDGTDNFIYDEKDNLIEEYRQNTSGDVPILMSHQKNKFNKKGLLVAELFLRENEIQYELLITYQ